MIKLGVFYNGIEICRDDKIIHARFLVPHRVISTCSVAGGLQQSLEYIYNHQSCEPSGHHCPAADVMKKSPEDYRAIVCERNGLPADRCATLGTAANMRYASLQHQMFRDLEVIAVCTGGVETNGGRAGDPASNYESDGIFEKLPSTPVAPVNGTINTMLFISKELTDGALVRTIMTATEAKTAALQELAVPSRYSDGLATGTGTDQIGVACRTGGTIPLTSAGKHSKLGELIGVAVHDAIKETLRLQNGLEPSHQRSVCTLTRRFGNDKETMISNICSHLSETDADLFRKNFMCIDRDPLVAGALCGFADVHDKIRYGILPSSCFRELYGMYAAQMASAVSGRPDLFAKYRNTLVDAATAPDNASLLECIYRSIAVGFTDKWAG
ncbi:MAG: adenosylcobinamide amidohydrolase [Fibrobacter sp.]|nr:adenosylcobinamide amidohydrolase [Fibrobacter sp.]